MNLIFNFLPSQAAISEMLSFERDEKVSKVNRTPIRWCVCIEQIFLQMIMNYGLKRIHQFIMNYAQNRIHHLGCFFAMQMVAFISSIFRMFCLTH